jgi:hypothetical protein
MKIENTITRETKSETAKFQNRFRQNINRTKNSFGY